MPEWEAILTLVFLSAVILTTIVGNILVPILSEVTNIGLQIVLHTYWFICYPKYVLLTQFTYL
jgi:hypothetical protein